MSLLFSCVALAFAMSASVALSIDDSSDSIVYNGPWFHSANDPAYAGLGLSQNTFSGSNVAGAYLVTSFVGKYLGNCIVALDTIPVYNAMPYASIWGPSIPLWYQNVTAGQHTIAVGVNLNGWVYPDGSNGGNTDGSNNGGSNNSNGDDNEDGTGSSSSGKSTCTCSGASGGSCSCTVSSSSSSHSGEGKDILFESFMYLAPPRRTIFERRVRASNRAQISSKGGGGIYQGKSENTHSIRINGGCGKVELLMGYVIEALVLNRAELRPCNVVALKPSHSIQLAVTILHQSLLMRMINSPRRRSTHVGVLDCSVLKRDPASGADLSIWRSSQNLAIEKLRTALASRHISSTPVAKRERQYISDPGYHRGSVGAGEQDAGYTGDSILVAHSPCPPIRADWHSLLSAEDCGWEDYVVGNPGWTRLIQSQTADDKTMSTVVGLCQSRNVSIPPMLHRAERGFGTGRRPTRSFVSHHRPCASALRDTEPAAVHRPRDGQLCTAIRDLPHSLSDRGIKGVMLIFSCVDLTIRTLLLRLAGIQCQRLQCLQATSQKRHGPKYLLQARLDRVRPESPPHRKVSRWSSSLLNVRQTRPTLRLNRSYGLNAAPAWRAN
ncbi:hypothetical protein BKA62DRAFT_676780 [Auriculariales sp. MPI-PUGE-AT-0066]|nr:hypothetical protein BKA62DRAFT_676780 [Auriculariales sp. MPI-PUGE-AT-0066]